MANTTYLVLTPSVHHAWGLAEVARCACLAKKEEKVRQRNDLLFAVASSAVYVRTYVPVAYVCVRTVGSTCVRPKTETPKEYQADQSKQLAPQAEGGPQGSTQGGGKPILYKNHELLRKGCL